MTCRVLGAGLVGSFLGAAAGAAWATGRARRPVRVQVTLPSGTVAWAPDVGGPDEAPLLIATRCHQTPWAALHGPVLAAQNGLGQPVAVAVPFLALDRDAQGTVSSTGPAPRLVVGPVDPAWWPVLAAWRRSGVQVDEVADVRPAQWEKAILNATVGPLCLATGLSMTAVWADAELRRLTLAATDEGAAVAAAAGIVVPPGLGHRATEFFARVGAHRPSIVADAGELPWVLGHLLQTAQRHGVAIPALGIIAARVGLAQQAA